MTDLTVYRSSNPDLIAAWHATNAAIQEWQPKVEALMEELGVGDRETWYDAVTGEVFGVSGGRDEVPDGWRYDQRKGYWVPRRSIKEGKAIGARLDAMRRPDPRALKGMPARTFAADRPALLTCGVDEIDGALYVRWSAAIRVSEVDATIWERLRLSEYYAVLEAQEAAKAVTADV